MRHGYDEYKSVEFVGADSVPEHWAVLPNYALFKERVERERNDLPLLSVTINRGVIRQEELGEENDISNLDKSKYKRVAPGDIVYNAMRMWQGAVGYSQYEGIVSPAYIVLEPKTTLNAEYFHYLFRTTGYTTESYRSSYGIADDQLSLRYPDFRRLNVFIPPKEEQDAIVKYLDRKTKEITRFIEAKQQLIGRLEEQRAAVVNRAVTKGLNAEVEMKSSSIEWLGEIPKGWQEIPLKRVANLIQTGPFGSQLSASEYVEDGIPVINPTNIAEGRLIADSSVAVSPEKAKELNRHRLDASDIVFARRGKLGACGLVDERSKGWLCGTGCIRTSLDGDMVNPHFAIHLLRGKHVADWLSIESIGATMDNISSVILGRLPIFVPPMQEQAHIVRYIEARTAKIDEAIERAEREIALIREYRQALIAEAVTGQIDVRNRVPATA